MGCGRNKPSGSSAASPSAANPSSPSIWPLPSPPAPPACAASRWSRPGRVLLYPAEDALHVVRRRLEGICAAAGAALAELDVQVITAPSLRLDLDADRARLDETVARLKPRLLVLDPFVRLHRIDENVSGDVAPLLAFLRDLQRRHAVAVAVVHHARKGAGAIRAGQALRGSSEFHAWGDSNLYLRRDGDDRIVPDRRTSRRRRHVRCDARTRPA